MVLCRSIIYAQPWHDHMVFVRRAITSLSGPAIYHSHTGIRVHSEYQEVHMMISMTDICSSFQVQTLKYF